MSRDSKQVWLIRLGVSWLLSVIWASPLLATPLAVPPQCGIAVVNNFSPPPAQDLCRFGSASPVAGPVPWVGPKSPIGPGRYFWSCANPAGQIHCVSSAGIIPGKGAVLNAAGDVGRTDYTTLPFYRNVYQACQGCNAGLEPMQLFALSNPHSAYWGNDGTTRMQNARRLVAIAEATGSPVPSASEQLWAGDWVDSFPTDSSTVVAGEPQMTIPPALREGFDKGRNENGFPNIPEFVAWRDFYSQHPQYWDIASNGGTMPVNWQSWHGQWGFISPLTPLDAVDCPPDMRSCTWGDSYAFRQAFTQAMSGGYGIGLSDFSDSFPYGNSTQQDFNPRIIAAFASFYRLQIPPGPIPAQAAWIAANAYNQWDDYLSRGYGRYFNALHERITTATGREGLVEDQCQGAPLSERSVGLDMRILATQISPKYYLCINDDHSLLGNDIAGSIVGEYGSVALQASYEPLMRQGGNFEADDPPYWKVVQRTYPSLDSAAQTEIGYKLLKRLWLWGCWAHIADRSGNVRRALAYVTRDYNDKPTGLSAPQLGPLQVLVQSINPGRPFGPAVYYSGSAMRTAERYFAKKWGSTQNLKFSGYEPLALHSFVDSGGPVNYYVSDVALNGIRAGGPNAPSAWIILGDLKAYDSLPDIPASELARLRSIAPVIDAGASARPGVEPGMSGAASVLALNQISNQPLSFTTAGGAVAVSDACKGMGFPVSVLSSTALTGFGFYDTRNALILVVSNPSPCPDAVGLSGTINLKNIQFGGRTADGTYALKDLFSGTGSSLRITHGAATIPVTVGRWDSLAFSVTP